MKFQKTIISNWVREKIEGITGPWEFKIIKPVSLFTAKNIVENISKK